MLKEITDVFLCSFERHVLDNELCSFERHVLDNELCSSTLGIYTVLIFG